MAQSWMNIVRVLLRGLKRINPEPAELEQLHIIIHQTNESTGLQNIGIITEFVTSKCWATEHMMVTIFDMLTEWNCCTVESCSSEVAYFMGTWIGENLLRQFTTAVTIKKLGSDLWYTNLANIMISRNPRLRIENDSYSHGIQTQFTITAQEKTDLVDRELDLSVLIRQERGSGTLLTSAELYVLIAMAASQTSRQPSRNSLEVRLLVVYSRWVQIVTAKMTRNYIISVVEGRDRIADHMEVYQTPWLNFTDIACQQQILLFAFDSIELRDRTCTVSQMPLKHIQPDARNSTALKRKLDQDEIRSPKRYKGGHNELG